MILIRILMCALFKGESVDELFKGKLGSSITQLLEQVLTVFLDYEKQNSVGFNSGNSRNGMYNRKINIRLSEFKQRNVSSYKCSTDNLESMVVQLYRKVITTSEIADLIEKMYGTFYTETSISNITQAVQEQVEQFHSHKLISRYALILADATFFSVQRDTVTNETLHVLIGNILGRYQRGDYLIDLIDRFLEAFQKAKFQSC